MRHSIFTPHFTPQTPAKTWERHKNTPISCVYLSIKTQNKGDLEAPPGFEPGDEGFADPGLTTWL